MDIVRVFIVDDHPIVRQGIRSVLANHPDLLVMGEAESGAQLFDALSSADELPDVVLLDIRLPGQGGIDVAKRLKGEYPKVKIIVLSTYDDDEYLFGALQAGAEGYLLKSTSHEVLATAIRQVGRGERLLSPALVGRVMRQFQDLAREQTQAASGLSDTELKVLRLIAAGATNKDIGEQLFWSEATAKRKVQDIIETLGVANRAQAVAEAAKRGLL